jgi:hypothetical protein
MQPESASDGVKCNPSGMKATKTLTADVVQIGSCRIPGFLASRSYPRLKILLETRPRA